MQSARKQIKIISLGEIVTPNMMKGIDELAQSIAKEKGVDQTAIKESLKPIFPKLMQLTDPFKLGEVDEDTFTKAMIDTLKDATGIELTESQFNLAWNAMNPKVEQFKAILQEAIDYNSPNQQIIFISFTNPKDIKHLITELKRGEIDHRVVNGQLVEIDGIELLTTYGAKQTKAQLIQATIERLNSKPAPQSSLANSMSQVFGSEAKHEPVDIKYIRGVYDAKKDPIFNQDATQAKTNQEINNLQVDTVIWKRAEIPSLTAALTDSSMPVMRVSVAKL